ncbi:SDR family oxidoreductase [Schlesneria paludicola]|uniref:SDR family oxidoreductase n=1 Tax=Schlesneria paludicola TaxID=360056 RepID=UPI000299D143|nr:SDR family oxidoreductase [Schlesneria paludicola]
MAGGDYLKDLFGLEGMTAVVIGGTGTLGGAFCDALAGAGAHVLVVGRNDEHGNERVRLIREQGGSAEYFPCNATERTELDALVTHLKATGRQANVLINGAGVNSPTPFLDISEEEWERILNVNLRGVRLACQVIGKDMIERGTKGSIINIASVSAGPPLSRVFTYSLSKAAVLSLTQNLAREWATKGIRVNALSPGFFPAEQNKKVLTPDRVENIMRHTPMARFGSPEELAGAVLLLASPTAGSYLTGHNLLVDGGFTAMTI